MHNKKEVLSEIFNIKELKRIIYFILKCNYKNLESEEKYRLNELNYELNIEIIDKEKLIAVNCEDGRKLIVKLVLCNNQNKYSDYIVQINYESNDKVINISSNLIRICNGLELYCIDQASLIYLIDGDLELNSVSKYVFSNEELKSIGDKIACSLGNEEAVNEIKNYVYQKKMD